MVSFLRPNFNLTSARVYRVKVDFARFGRSHFVLFGCLIVSAEDMVSAADTKGITMKLAIIQAAIMAALFLIAAAVSYHSGYVGGRVDEAMETEVAE